MTELSFFEHAANQVANHTATTTPDNNFVIGNATEEEYKDGYEEKHVTIDEELPVVYKPKSFSVPDLMDDATYEGSRHQHPALKFSISNSSTDTTAFLRKWFPKEKTTTCSPLASRRHKVKDATVVATPTNKKKSKDPSVLSSLWSKSELSRDRGKTHPQYTISSSDEEQQQQQQQQRQVDSKVLSAKRRSLSSNTYDPKWLSFWRKINIFKLSKSGNTNNNNYDQNNKQGKRAKKKKMSKSAEPSFDDLPPIRCSASTSDLLRYNSGGDGEANNNTSNNMEPNNHHNNSRSRESDYLFSVSKSYKPTEQCRKNSKSDDCVSSTVKLKRIRSLPIL